MIGVIDVGLSNVGSVLNMFKYVGHEAVGVCDESMLDMCSKLVLPGVGSFDAGIEQLQKSGLVDILSKKVLEDRIPVLGICLGMQLMCAKSEEGVLPGLGWVDAVVKDFKGAPDSPAKTPHMGWNTVEVKKSSYWTAGLVADSRFYFVHSYFVDCKQPADVMLTTKYGFEFASAFQVNNIIGMQFHPEKSHVFGAEILKKFGDFR